MPKINILANGRRRERKESLDHRNNTFVTSVESIYEYDEIGGSHEESLEVGMKIIQTIATILSSPVSKVFMNVMKLEVAGKRVWVGMRKQFHLG